MLADTEMTPEEAESLAQFEALADADEAPAIQASVRSEAVLDNDTVVLTQTIVVDHTEAPADGPELEYDEVVEEVEGRSTVITRYNVKASA